MSKQPEVWLRGPVPAIDPYLQPVAHSLLQVREDVEGLRTSVTGDVLWQQPGGAAALGFHLGHIGGSLDRLFTYARGESLSPAQLAMLRNEGVDQGQSLHEIVDATIAAIDRALAQLRQTSSDDLLMPQKVGRAGLPSTTLGLLFHAAEHATRHTGQAVTTARAVNHG